MNYAQIALAIIVIVVIIGFVSLFIGNFIIGVVLFCGGLVVLFGIISRGFKDEETEDYIKNRDGDRVSDLVHQIARANIRL